MKRERAVDCASPEESPGVVPKRASQSLLASVGCEKKRGRSPSDRDDGDGDTKKLREASENMLKRTASPLEQLQDGETKRAKIPMSDANENRHDEFLWWRIQPDDFIDDDNGGGDMSKGAGDSGCA